MRPSLLALLVLGLLASAIIAQECTIDDYEGQYTQCRVDNTHDLVYYLKRNSTCTGGVHPPSPVFDLPCNITCGEGQYLPLGSLVCSSCAPGSFTTGGGPLVSEWNQWPTELGFFSTFCINNLNNIPANCSGWVLTGGTVRSGAITDAQSSILVLQTQLIVAGVVRFSYRVNAEPGWDGLIFYVDGVVVLPKVSVTYSFVDFVANVSAGYHTLRWEYYKDRSQSKGEDAVFVSTIQITGLTYAESSCTPCEPGTYAPGTASVQCAPCPLNTYSAGEGSDVCTACPDGQFTYVGSSACLPKVPCTAADYQVLYGPCSSGRTRTATANWLLPHICDDSALPLPAPATVPCAPCPPGTSQDASFNCVPCPTGTFSTGGSASCQSCGSGKAAPKVFNFSTFDSWPDGVTTYCSGYCGSDGWRLRSGFIDSGSGHGVPVDSSLNLEIVLEQAGFVTFTFLLKCTRFCALYYLDYPYDAAIQWNTSTQSIGNNTLFTYTTPIALEVGQHNLTWTFESEPYDPFPNDYTNAAQIYSIVINGSSVGGASSCTPCSNGSVAVSGASACSNCTAGYSNDATYSQCVPCAGNTFSPQQGGNCLTCGPTTIANNNHTDCLDNCTFVINGDTYDLTLLSRYPFGPVYDGEYYYYINLCGRGNFITDCHDIDDVPLNTHVCQVLPYGYALDVGWSSGYYAIPVNVAEKGFRVHYDLGTLGCGPKNNGVAFPRNSDLTFICDPSAGLGTLDGGDIVENPPCHYNFVWRSLYACPVCTANDYTFYYTLCGSNGKRNKIYYWKDPVLCHDGVKLPANEEVSCSDSTVFCGIGQQLGPDGQTCISCPAGEYSVGGGLLIRSWPVDTLDLPYEYTTSCIGSCTPWVSDDGISIHSGTSDSSLYGTHIFRTYGSISFDYKVFFSGNGAFTFYIDGIQQLLVQQVSLYEWTNFSFPIAPGSHIFQWRFTGGIRYSPSLLSYQGVSIYNIFIQGLDYHADTCLPCPDGTYSTPDPSVIGCLPCPGNTYNTPQTSGCTPCPAGQFSLPGSTSCLDLSPCTADSYIPSYTACVDGQRGVTYSRQLPITCAGGVPQPLPQQVPCGACPPYTVSQNNGTECVSCQAGYYYYGGECINNIAGFIVQYSQYYFNDDSTASWPKGFFTGCSGMCGNDGWRIAGASINSGFHASNAVDSYVGIVSNFLYNGQVTFTYTLNTAQLLDGLQFAIDDIVVPIQVPQNESLPVTVSVPVSNGWHKLVWNYHQEVGSGWASLNNIVLLGVEGGASAAATIPCEPGLFATDPAATNCSLCVPGTYSPVAGSSACAPCLEDTYNPNYGANECKQCDEGSSAGETGSTQCNTSCTFVIRNDLYALTSLPGPITVYDDARRKYIINVCNNVGAPCPNSHSCLINADNTVIQAGNSFRFIPDAENSTASPFAIAFEHGDACPGSDAQRSTVIQFECEIENPSNVPDYQGQDENCVTLFSWRTTIACRLCTEKDYTTVTGACSGGHRKVSNTRIYPCNGPASIPVKDEKCSGQEFPVAAIVVIVIVFVAVVAIAIFIFFRNRRLSAQYKSLIEETRSSNVSM